MEKADKSVVLAIVTIMSVLYGCSTLSELSEQRSQRMQSGQAQARVRPVRPSGDIKIMRVDQPPLKEGWFCKVVADGALTYTQGGITRPISNPFPCPLCFCKRQPTWCDGTRRIFVDYPGGEIVSVPDVWPGAPE